MKPKLVKFSKSFAIVSNFQKVAFEAGIEGEVESGETAQAAYLQAKTLVMEQLTGQIGDAIAELTALSEVGQQKG